MDINKRYCQSRLRKRKRNIENFANKNEDRDIEEERQFKLKRFVQDVHKFVEGKCQEEKALVAHKSKPEHINRPVKKVKRARPVIKTHTFQNGMQTRFYSRGMVGKEMTARLDKNLQQIIALTKNNDSDCQCSHSCGKSTFLTDNKIPARSPLQVLTSRSSTTPNEWKSPVPSATVTTCNNEPAVENRCVYPPQNEFESELYSEFVRIITISSSKSLSIEFKSKKLNLFNRRKENSQKTDESKISVGTSPLSELQTDSEHTFTGINFVPERTKSTLQFLEETIGPPSSGPNVSLSPDLQQGYYSSPHHYQYSHPSSPPHWLAEPRKPKYIHEPLPTFLTTSPSFHLRSETPRQSRNTMAENEECAVDNTLDQMVFDGGGDRSQFNLLNSFMPSADEESPVFQYFPRRMF